MTWKAGTSGKMEKVRTCWQIEKSTGNRKKNLKRYIYKPESLEQLYMSLKVDFYFLSLSLLFFFGLLVFSLCPTMSMHYIYKYFKYWCFFKHILISHVNTAI